MANIRIKKRVTLEFLGDEYNDSYLEFYALPIKEYKSLVEQIEAIGEDNQKATEAVIETLKKNFVAGKISVDGKLEDVDAEDIESLDIETILKSYQRYTGTDLDPKG